MESKLSTWKKLYDSQEGVICSYCQKEPISSSEFEYGYFSVPSSFTLACTVLLRPICTLCHTHLLLTENEIFLSLRESFELSRGNAQLTHYRELIQPEKAPLLRRFLIDLPLEFFSLICEAFEIEYDPELKKSLDLLIEKDQAEILAQIRRLKLLNPDSVHLCLLCLRQDQCSLADLICGDCRQNEIKSVFPGN
jgi:hypothetical protein